MIEESWLVKKNFPQGAQTDFGAHPAPAMGTGSSFPMGGS